MLRNYLTIALRNLRRNLRHMIINVLGLGFAVAFCILAFLVWRFANSFDSWHGDVDRIFHVETIKESNGENAGICPTPIAILAKDNLPGVEMATTFDGNGTVVKRGEAVFNERIFFTDENFRHVFDFELASGSDDLSDRNHVLITEEMAVKYFGKENPIGQELLFFADAEYKKPLIVGGIFKKLPLNSSIRFGFLTHRDNQMEGGKRPDYSDWKKQADGVFLKLKTPGDRAAVQTALQNFTAPQNSAQPEWKIKTFRLNAMLELALASREMQIYGLWEGVPPAAVWGNIVLAAILLLAAILNFANMTLALCNRRLREMGVRKVMGGTRFQIIRQLLVESFLVVLLGGILGFFMAFPVMDWFNATWKFTDFRLKTNDLQVLTYLGAVILATTFLAGIYPAFYVSAFRPASIFRGGVLTGGGSFFSRSMMGFQVVISIFAVITAISFAQNAEFNRSADLGYSYQNMLQAWTPSESAFHLFENSAKNVPGVVKTCGTRHLPGFGFSYFDTDFHGENHTAAVFDVGNDFLKMMDFKLVSGVMPVPAGDTTISPEVVVNQKFVLETCAGKSPIGEKINLLNTDFRIVGVVADFMTDRPFSPISPTVIRQVPANKFLRTIVQTASPEQSKIVLAALENEWKKVFPFTPVNLGYQNEVLQEALEVSTNIANTMNLFAIVTILLCITGLFSIISLDVQKRTREVAVRRVLGASAKHITWILNKKLVVILVLAVAVGCFLGKFFSTLLMDSIFKINAGVQPISLIIGTAGVLVIVVLTIGLKIWQTLRVNPADVLRGE